MPYKNGLPCLCELCICGKHSCPHKIRKGSHSNGYCPLTVSEYTRRYVPHELKRVLPIKPTERPSGGDQPLTDLTTHRHDFIKHPLEKPKKRVPDPYIQPEGKIDDTTVYRQNYIFKRPTKLKSFRQVPRTEPSGKFIGEPTYQSDYRTWPMPKKKPTVKADPWTPSADQFESLTNYMTDYMPHNQRPPESCKPSQVPYQSDQPFESVTDYKQTYVPHPVGPREPLQKDEKKKWRTPACPMDSISTVQRDYTPKEGGRLPSFKPEAKAFKSDQPLSDQTTHRRDFKPYDVEKRYRSKEIEYVPPEGDIQTDTTYMTDYHSYPDIKQRQGFYPVYRKEPVAPFNGSTNYKTDYRGWNVPKPSLIRRDDKWCPPTELLDDMTTNRKAYISHPAGCQPKSCKPEVSYLQSNQPLDDLTTYKQEYVKKSVICPAMRLENFKLSEQDESTGHKFYEPLYVTVQNINSNVCTNVPLEVKENGEFVFKMPGSSEENILVS